MKKIVIFLSLGLVAMLMFSCDKAIFKQFDDDFPDNRWMKSDVRRYAFEIAEAGNYNLMVNFSSVYGSPFASVPVTMVIEYPDGKVVTEDLNILLADEQGNLLTDCSGDFCDLEQAIFADRKLEAGAYKISLANTFDHEFLPNVLGVGIRVVAVNK